MCNYFRYHDIFRNNYTNVYLQKIFSDTFTFMCKMSLQKMWALEGSRIFHPGRLFDQTGNLIPNSTYIWAKTISFFYSLAHFFSCVSRTTNRWNYGRPDLSDSPSPFFHFTPNLMFFLLDFYFYEKWQPISYGSWLLQFFSPGFLLLNKK